MLHTLGQYLQFPKCQHFCEKEGICDYAHITDHRIEKETTFINEINKSG